jgi:hypothetical protein
MLAVPLMEKTVKFVQFYRRSRGVCLITSIAAKLLCLYEYLNGTEVLYDNNQYWLEKMTPEDFRGLTPLFYHHVNHTELLNSIWISEYPLERKERNPYSRKAPDCGKPKSNKHPIR